MEVELRTAIWLVLQLTEVVLGMAFLFPQMLQRNRQEKQIWKYWLAVLAAGGLYAYNGLFSFVATLLPPMVAVLAAGLICFLWHRDFRVTFVWMLFYLFETSLVKLTMLMFECIGSAQNFAVRNHRGAEWSGVMAEAILIASVYFVFAFFQRRGISVIEICKKYTVLLLIECVSAYFLMSYVMLLGGQEIRLPALLLNLCVIVIVNGGFIILLQMYINGKEKEENKLRELRRKVMDDYYREIQNNYERTLKTEHDIRKQWSYLYQCLKTGEQEEALSFLEEKEHFFQMKKRVWTGNKAVDVMISLKKEEMDEKGIDFQLKSEFVRMPFTGEDICILLGNLLDNAIEAAEQCKEEERWIRLFIADKNDMFQLKVTNSSSAVPRTKAGRFFSTKDGGIAHGWGIKSVKEIAEHNGGTAEFQYTEKQFEARVVIWSMKRI